MGSGWMRNTLVYLLILVAVIALVVAFSRPSPGPSTRRDFNEVIGDAKAGRIQRIELTGDRLEVTVADGGFSETYTSRKEGSASLVHILLDNGVDVTKVPIEVKEPSQLDDWVGLLIQFLPILMFIGLVLFMMRAQGTYLHSTSSGKSPARMFTTNKPSATFIDVAGLDRAKKEAVVHVEMWPGRTQAQKEELAQVITEALVRIARTTPESTIIIFQEVARENWAQGGHLSLET